MEKKSQTICYSRHFRRHLTALPGVPCSPGKPLSPGTPLDPGDPGIPCIPSGP